MTVLGEAFVPIRATLDKLDGDLAAARGKVEGAMGKIGQVASGIGKSLQTAGVLALGGIGAIAGAAVGAAGGLALLAANAEPLIGLEQGFAAVTERIGTSSETMLASLQEASGGLITNRDLMASFNKAAALVSDDFAESLPDAMSLVRRAAQATGQDMGFLFDSLVTGVGRVSPMILDNLGIQVQLAEVTERASEMFGKNADELSKVEQQAALNEIVMEKLTAAYGNVPDTSMTFAKIKTSLSNLKDEIGKRVLPVIGPLAEKVMGLAEKALPPLFDILDNKVLPVVMKVSDAVGKFFDVLGSGGSPLDAVMMLVGQLGMAFGLSAGQMYEITSGIREFIAGVQEVIAAVMPYIEMAWEWITQNIALQDVLIALGVVIGAVVLPAIWGIISAAAPVVAVVVGLIGLIALVRSAWENDWGGIRTAITNFWEETGQPIFEQLKEWLAVNIPIAIEALKTFWENVLLPAIQNVWSWISGTLIPFFQDTVVPWLAVNIPAAIETLRSFWEDKLLPAINAVWSFIETYLLPIFQDIIDITGRVIELAITAMQGAWENVLLPAIEAVWGFIQDKLLPIFEDIQEFIEDKLGPVVQWLADDVFTPLANTLEGGVKRALEWLHEKLEDIKKFLDNFKLPWWLTPGSPTPFEMGLLGINEALRQLSMTQLPRLSAELELQPVGGLAGLAAASEGGTGQVYAPTYNIYGARNDRDMLERIKSLDMLYGG